MKFLQIEQSHPKLQSCFASGKRFAACGMEFQAGAPHETTFRDTFVIAATITLSTSQRRHHTCDITQPTSDRRTLHDMELAYLVAYLCIFGAMTEAP